MTLTGHIAGIKGNTGNGIASIIQNGDYTITIEMTDGSSYTTEPIAGFTNISVDEDGNLEVETTSVETVTLDIGLSEYQTAIEGYKEDSETSATSAKEDALKAEGYSVGKQNGSDVPSGEYYHNNAKYYSQQASTSASNALASETAVAGIAPQLSSRMLMIENEQAVQDARMDSFVTLAEGSTTGDAELADIRVGADGTTYSTAGDATRGQVTDLKRDINNVADIAICNNLVNPNNAIFGFIESNGEISSSDTYRVSDYIPVDVGKYSVQYCSYIGAYDSNKNFIARYSGNGSSPRTYNFIQSEGIAYIRMTYNSDPTNWRCNKGDTIINEDWFDNYVRLKEPVEIPYQIDTTLLINEKAADAKVVGEYLKKTGVFTSEFKAYNYDIYNSDFIGWYTGQNNSYVGKWDSDNIPTGDGFGWLTTYAHVISKFDALMTLSDGYITKNALGTASGTDGNGNPYTLYEYVLKPKHYSVENPETLTMKVPKLLFTCCQHGFEKNIVYGAYYFINDLVNNWNKSDRLKAIRHHTEIHIIPIVNPWGFDNDSYLNANGVNLNRNYDVPNWIYYPPTDTANSSGETPFDQPETQIIRDWVGDNDDALMLIDGHTNGHYYASGYNNMNSLMAYNDTNDWYFNKLFRVFVREIENQTAMFPEMYPAIQPDPGNTATSFCGRTQDGMVRENNRGVIDLWCIKSMNLISFTLETFNGLLVNDSTIIGYMSEDAKKICSEIIGNCISEIIREYASI